MPDQMKKPRYLIRKEVAIQFRLTPDQFERLKTIAKKYGDRENNVARMLFINAMMKEEGQA
jgi:hypothetical protein